MAGACRFCMRAVTLLQCDVLRLHRFEQISHTGMVRRGVAWVGYVLTFAQSGRASVVKSTS